VKDPVTGVVTDDPGFFEGLVCYLRFEPDTVFKESTSSLDAFQLPEWDAQDPRIFPPYPTLENPTATTLVSQILNRDINGDGDRTDTYVRGRIVKLIYAPRLSMIETKEHPAGFKLNNKQMTNLLLSRELISDNVMMRYESAPPTPGSPYLSDFDAHPPYSKPSKIDGLFRYVGSKGELDIAPLPEVTESSNAQGLLIWLIHGDYDGTPGGFLTRKNSQLIRTRSQQAK